MAVAQSRSPGWGGGSYRQETRCVLVGGQVARQEGEDNEQVDSEWHLSSLAPRSREPGVGLRYATPKRFPTPKEACNFGETLLGRTKSHGLQSGQRMHVTLVR